MRSHRPNRLIQRHRDRRGAAVVEAAIVLPVIAMILLGAIDVGQSIYVAQVVNEASREAARQASRFDTTSEDVVRTRVREFIRGSFSNAADTAIDVNFSSIAGEAVPSGDLTAVASGSPITVQVILQYDAVRWIPGFIGLGGRSIETTTTMRRE